MTRQEPATPRERIEAIEAVISEWAGPYPTGKGMTDEQCIEKIAALVTQDEALWGAFEEGRGAGRTEAEAPPADLEERLRAALMQVAPQRHGQLCPVWTRRQYGDGECNCFIRTQAAEHARVVVTAMKRAG